MHIEGLGEQLNEQELKILKEGLLAQARTVGEAAGGFLGLTSKISKEDAEMLDAAFRG